MLKIEINIHYNKHECSVLLMDCEFYLSFYSNNWVVFRTDVALLCCSISFNISQAASFQFLFHSDSWNTVFENSLASDSMTQIVLSVLVWLLDQNYSCDIGAKTFCFRYAYHVLHGSKK